MGARRELAMPPSNEIDEAILSVVTSRWQKVAMVIAKASELRRDKAAESDDQDIAARIESLIDAGKLQCQGDPKHWRRSEVRLPREAPERLYYVATVAIVFPALEPEGPDKFDLYEMDILLESDSRAQAVKDAIAISKASPALRKFDHVEPPVLHAVRKIQHEYPQNTLSSWRNPQGWFPVHVAKIDQKALEALKTGDGIQLWYGFVHVDGQ